jgi:hypothetical protein
MYNRTLPDQLPKHPFRILIHGRSGQGKSTLWIKLYKAFYSSFFERVILFCPNFYYDPKYNYVDESKVTVYEEVTPESLARAWKLIRSTNKRTLLWFDDCMGQPGMRCKELAKIIINVRHNNTSTVALIQEVVGVAPVYRRQCEVFIGFQTQDEDDKNMIYKNFGFGTKQEFLRLYDECTRLKYSFILMNRQGPVVSYYNKFQLIKHI